MSYIIFVNPQLSNVEYNTFDSMWLTAIVILKILMLRWRCRCHGPGQLSVMTTHHPSLRRLQHSRQTEEYREYLKTGVKYQSNSYNSLAEDASDLLGHQSNVCCCDQGWLSVITAHHPCTAFATSPTDWSTVNI